MTTTLITRVGAPIFYAGNRPCY